jgi:aminoglycoside phosphotransferase (APT) family kinase protein
MEQMFELDDVAFRRLVERINPRHRLLRAWPLTGGVSARVTTLEVADPDGRTNRWVARQHGARDRQSNPRIARDEFRLLQIVRERGVAAPEPLFVDESRELFADPVVVLAFVEGETIFETPDVAGLVARSAEQLARINSVLDGPDLAFLPRAGRGFGARPETLDESLSEGRIRDALESVEGLSRHNAPALLHNDFWPGNLLWSEGRLAAVIDWEDAAVGDPLVDLGNARMEFLFWFGAEGMETFTERYRALTGVDMTDLPLWDLQAALRPCGRMSQWGLDDATEERLRERHAWFIEQAIARLEGHRGSD